MKVLLYSEAYDRIKKSGVGKALSHQMKALELNGIDYTLDLREPHDIIHINTMEEEADALFISSMHELHNTSTDALEIIACREVYMYLEKCADACEHVADVVESVVMKNS